MSESEARAASKLFRRRGEHFTGKTFEVLKPGDRQRGDETLRRALERRKKREEKVVTHAVLN